MYVYVSVSVFGTSHCFPVRRTGDAQNEKLPLSDYITYDEMAIAALLGVSCPTIFINNGSRDNRGRPADAATFERDGTATSDRCIICTLLYSPLLYRPLLCSAALLDSTLLYSTLLDSYSTLLHSALLLASVPSAHVARAADLDCTKGIYCGMVGARFERFSRMESIFCFLDKVRLESWPPLVLIGATWVSFLVLSRSALCRR